MKNAIVGYLLEKGLKPHYKGFSYLVRALMLTTDAKTRIPIGEVYTLVAQDCGVTKDRVERCIRTIVTTYFNNMESPPKYKYTNAEFIYLCTEEIKLQELITTK